MARASSAVVVRPSTTADFEAWFALFEAVAAEGRWLGAEAPLDRTARREFFDRCLDRREAESGPCDSTPQPGDAAILVAEVDGTLAGAVSLQLTRGVVDLGMFVAADRRGAGVGTALVEAAVAWAREVGAHKVALAVWPHNHPARTLYTRFGFVTEGRRRRHHRRRSGELWDSVLMGLIFDTTSPGGPEAD